MANDWMGQILGRVLGGGGAAQPSAPGGGLGGGLGDVLGGILGGERGSSGDAGPAGGHGMLMALLLPLAMQWVQRNGGLGAVLERFRQKGYGQQADSWVSNAPNQALAPQQVSEVVGDEELSRLSQQLGVDRQQVAGGLAEILPRMVDHLTPAGQVTPQADQALDRGRISLEQALGQLRSS